MELRPSLKMGKSICAKSSISYLTTAPSEFETFKLSLMAVALAYIEWTNLDCQIEKKTFMDIRGVAYVWRSLT